MLRTIRRAVLLLIAIAALVAGAFAFLFVRGVWGVDDWTLRQIIALAQTYLEPRMTFEGFDFDLPATAKLRGVRFTASDGTDVLAARAVAVTLAERPKKGEPIRIRDVRLEGADLRLIRDEATGGFKGLLPFVKTRAIAQQETVAPETRLSEVFEIRDLSLVDGAITFDPGSGQPPMRLTGLTLDLDVQPMQAGDEPGWYAFAFDSGKAPLATIVAAGALNLDTLLLRLERLSLAANLRSEADYAALPPAVQSILRAASARGELAVEASGEASLREPNAATLDASLTLRDFFVALGDYQFPIEEGEIAATMRDRALLIDKALISTLSGAVQATQGSVDLSSDDATPAVATIAVDKLDLQQFLSSRLRGDEQTPPRFAGLVSGEVSVQADARAARDTLSGEGWVQVRDGRLLALPLLGDIASTLDDALAFLSGEDILRAERRLRDELDAQFTLNPQGVNISAFELTTPAILARGRGTIAYDQSLDMRVNAGVVERLQKRLGGLGDILGFITDSLLSYKVTGAISEPKIEPSPLGL